MQFRRSPRVSIRCRGPLQGIRRAQGTGYDPINQLVGYIISGDPTYITSHNNARYLIRRLERDEILGGNRGFYLKNLDEKKG